MIFDNCDELREFQDNKFLRMRCLGAERREGKEEEEKGGRD